MDTLPGAVATAPATGGLSMAVPLISGLLGAGAGLIGAKQQQDFQASQAQKQMDFQERMSSTAEQRHVADLKAAGLNPALAYNTMASSPPGAMAGSATSPAQGAAAGATAGISSALAAKQAQAQLANLIADNYNKVSQGNAAAAAADVSAANADAIRQQMGFDAAHQPFNLRKWALENTVLGGQAAEGTFKSGVFNTGNQVNGLIQSSAKDAAEFWKNFSWKDIKTYPFTGYIP